MLPYQPHSSRPYLCWTWYIQYNHILLNETVCCMECLATELESYVVIQSKHHDIPDVSYPASALCTPTWGMPGRWKGVKALLWGSGTLSYLHLRSAGAVGS